MTQAINPDWRCECMHCVTHRQGPAAHLQWRAECLVKEAAAAGLVLTVEQRPLQPLAMRHYETVVSVRPARGS